MPLGALPLLRVVVFPNSWLHRVSVTTRRPPVFAVLTSRRLFAIIGVVVLLLALFWRLDLLDVRTSMPFASVASAFDDPPGYPGYGWTRGGSPVAREEIVTAAGPGHCNQQSATFLTIGWPPGTKAFTFSAARLYTRDPNGVVAKSLRDALVRRATLPGDSVSTGYRHGVLEIFVSPSEAEEGIYVVSPSDVERWPRNTRGGCS